MKKIKKLISCALAACCVCTAMAAAQPASAAQSGSPLFISEVCFNPNYEKGETKVISNNDYFEFIEVKNTGSESISLENAAVYYSKSGLSGSSWYKNSLVFDEKSSKTIEPGQVFIFGIYTISTPELGLGYSTQSELSSYWNAFNSYYGVNTSTANRALAVAAESGKTTWLSGGTSLPNNGSIGAVKIGNSSETFGKIEYSPDTYSQDGYSLNSIYSGGNQYIWGNAGCTPLTIQAVQLPESDSRTAPQGSPVALTALNVCYDINGVTPGKGSASDYAPEKRLPGVITYLNNCGADIICLSEISAQWWSGINSALQGSYTLSGNMSCYGLSDGAAHERATDSYNPIYFSSSAYTLLEEGHTWLLESSPSVGNKICNYCLLKNNNDNTIFAVFNTHLSANNNNENFHNRVVEANNLSKFVNDKISALTKAYKKQTSSIPYIICGDFNVNEYSEVYRSFIQNAKVKNSKYLARTTTPLATFNNWGNYTETNGTVIDFCFVSDGIDCANYNSRQIKNSAGYLASDHSAVRVNLTVSNSKEQGGSSLLPDIQLPDFNFDFSSVLQFFSSIASIFMSFISFIVSFVSSFMQ